MPRPKRVANDGYSAGARYRIVSRQDRPAQRGSNAYTLKEISGDQFRADSDDCGKCDSGIDYAAVADGGQRYIDVDHGNRE